ncbi:MAG: hypothetical protein OHK0017_05720 [Patescibacteria group bacterium]
MLETFNLYEQDPNVDWLKVPKAQVLVLAVSVLFRIANEIVESVACLLISEPVDKLTPALYSAKKTFRIR